MRMLAGRAVEHRTGQIRAKIGQQLKQIECSSAHGLEHGRMLLALVELAVGLQLGFDLGVVGKGRVLGQAQLAGRLALGEVEIDNAVLRHQARRRTGDAGTGPGRLPGSFMSGHGDSIRVKSGPF